MEYTLETLINIPLLQNLQEKLNVIYSFPSAIIDNNGKVLTAVAWQDICTKFHRIHPECEKECIKSDRYILDHLHEANPAVSYQCPHGLIDNATPIIIEGNHLGNFFTGQFFLEQPDLEFFKKQAQTYGFDERAYLEAVAKVPVWTREKLDQYLDFIKGFIEIIANIGLNQLKEIEAHRIMRENEKRNRIIIQSTSDWIWELDQHGKFSYCSERVESILGYSVEEIIGKSLFDLMPKNECESIRAIFQNTSETKEPLVDIENWKLHKNGSRVCFLTNCSPVLDEKNKVIGYIGADKDITERKHREEALHQSEEKLRASNLIIEGIINSIPVRVFWKDKNLVYLGCNAAFAVDGGYSYPEDIIGKDDFQMGWSDQAELYRSDDRYVIDSGCPKLNIEEPQTTPDGKTIMLLTSKIPLRNSAGETTGILGTYMDITEHKASEQKVKESELKFRTVADYTFNWEYWQAEDQQIRYISPSCARVTGYTPDEFISNPALLQKIIHPDDLDAFLDHQKQIIHDDHPHHTCDFDYRVIHKDGAIVYINHLCRPVFDECQKYIGRRVSNIDITERVLKEKDLIAAKNSLLVNEEKLRVLFDTMTEGVALNEIIYNDKHEMIDYRILEVNKTFYKITNTTPEQVIGNVATQLYRMPVEYIKAFGVQHEIVNETTHTEMQSPVGDDTWFYVSTSPFQDDKFVTVFFDITDRKRKERLLKDSEDKFRTMSEQSVDLIALTDNNGIINYASSSSNALFHCEPDEMCGRSFMEFLHESSVAKAIDAFQHTLGSGESVNSLELTMKRKDGSLFVGELSGSLFQSSSQNGTLVNIHDITERKQTELRLDLSTKILTLLNRTAPFDETIRQVVKHIQDALGYDAVGIRVKTGDDYPYFSQIGFNSDFLKTENSLIERTKEGGICTDKNGKPCLECTCGLVISGKTDSTHPLFTEGGSFWTNDSPVLLGLTAEQEPGHNPRNRCIHDGYQSFALVPIRNNEEIIGLLQLNDKKKDCFSPIMIKYLETIGETIGVAFMRKQAEEALKHSHELLLNLTEQVPGVVYQYRLFPDGRSCFPYSSSGMFEIYEYTPEDVREDATPVFGRIHPDDLQRVSELIFESARTLQQFFCEMRVVLPGQGLRWRYSTAVPQRMDDGSTLWHGIIYDITDRKLAETALLDSEKLYRNLVETSLDGVYKSSHDGKFIEVNPAMVRMLGYETKEELMAIDIKTQLYFEPADRESLIQQELLEETGVYRLRRKDGSEIWVEDHAWYDFDENGNILFHEGILRDITDRKIAEDEIRLLNETLELRIAERTKQLENVNRELAFHVDELEQFAYVSNHDLNEPLRTLTQFTQLLQDEYSGKLDADGNKYVEFIYNSGLRMKELVTGLFNYTPLGRDRILTAIDCNVLVNAVLNDLNHSIMGSNAIITVQELPTVNGHETELRLLFQNLIANALKFHKNDESPEISISAVNREKEWLFSIRDNGIGIESKHKDKIFIIFQRLHKRNEFSGTGIGLAHCKKVVELHGGKIWVESEPGAGSTFKFTIPVV